MNRQISINGIMDINRNMERNKNMDMNGVITINKNAINVSDGKKKRKNRIKKIHREPRSA